MHQGMSRSEATTSAAMDMGLDVTKPGPTGYPIALRWTEKELNGLVWLGWLVAEWLPGTLH